MSSLEEMFADYGAHSQRRALVRQGIAAACGAMRAVSVGARYARLPLYPKQGAIVDDPHRFTITEATTKAGKTMSHIEWLLEEAAGRRSGNWWWIATVSGTSQIAYRRTLERLRGFIDTGGELQRVSDPIPFKKHDSEKWIDVFGARLWFKSAEKPDNLYGEDVYGAVGDEVSRWREEAWHALYSTLTATRGRAKLIGNVKGRRNWAYLLARKAEGGEPDWGYHKLTAFDAIEGGVIDSGIVDQARRDLPEAVFRELYLAEPSDDTGNPFGIDAIRACIAPISAAAPAAWGWDIAKHVDWTVGIALDNAGTTCRLERWNKTKLPAGMIGDYWDATERRMRDLTGYTQAFVDSTGGGDQFFERASKGRPRMEPYLFTGKSKQQLMEGLAVAIQQRRVKFPPGPIVNELEAFEYAYGRTGVKYSAPEGMHDDCVCALALAVAKQGIPVPRQSGTGRTTGL